MYFGQPASIMRHCPSSCSSGVDIDRVVRDAKRIFCNTPRTASMRRHDRLFADPNVKHVSQNHLPLLQLEKFVMFQAGTYGSEKLFCFLVLCTHCVSTKLTIAFSNFSPAYVVLVTLAVSLLF